jgi:hypothetical protein
MIFSLKTKCCQLFLWLQERNIRKQLPAGLVLGKRYAFDAKKSLRFCPASFI